jgi:hypothetical protein
MASKDAIEFLNGIKAMPPLQGMISLIFSGMKAMPPYKQ